MNREPPVILQLLMYFTASTLLFISCNCSPSWLPGETWCWNREVFLKKYKLLKPWMALWIKNAILNYTWKWSRERWSLRSADATVGRRGGARAGSLTLACWVFCRSALNALVTIRSSCKLSPVQLSQYIPDDKYDADLLEEIFLGRKTITSQSKTMELNQCYMGIKQNRTFGQLL